LSTIRHQKDTFNPNIFYCITCREKPFALFVD
jgi:hypothetical protein